MSQTTEPTALESDSSSSAAISRGKWLVLLAAFLGWMFDGLEMGIVPQIARPALTQMFQPETAKLRWALDELGKEAKDSAVKARLTEWSALTDDRLPPALQNLRTTSPDKDVKKAAGAVWNKALEDRVKYWHQWIDGMFLFGAALGGLVFGWLGDKIGRVKAMATSILVYSGFTGCLYFVHTPLQFAALRFTAAIGMGGEWALGVALVMEVWDAKHRPMLAGLIGAASNVGFVLVSAICLFAPPTETSWRWIVLTGAAPALLTFLIQIFVPESHKWKESQKKAPSRPIRELFGDRKLAITTVMAICFASVSLLGTWGAVQKIPAWTKAMPSATAMSSGMAGVLLGVGAIIGCIIAPMIASAFNRRIAYFLLCLTSLVTCQLIFNYFSDYTWGFMGMTMIVGGLSAAFYGWLPLYLPELFPTRVRATAQGIAFNFGRIAAGVGAIWGGTIGGSYAKMGAIVSLIYLVGMAIIWFAPETKGKPLPE